MHIATTADHSRSSVDSTNCLTVAYGARVPSSGAVPGRSGGAPETTATQPLDRRAFGALVDLEASAPGFLAELVTEFQAGATERVQAIQQAVRAGDIEALKFAAHTLRGSCGTIGAWRMATLAGRLEDAPPMTPEAAWPLIHRLETEYHAVRHALAEVVPGARAAAVLA